ncbi:hypothetical protein [Luteitalea sp.]|uniref:hypothetical protein n=1 Tax=Luteitalea sp. TaxID=2004800 RepID=UPI0025BE1877|nr:hypothetical protein [Luteitalea sp.]
MSSSARPRGAPRQPDALRRVGRVIFVRLSPSEYQALRLRAQADEDTLSGVIREALYEYGIDPFTAPSSICGQTPR